MCLKVSANFSEQLLVLNRILSTTYWHLKCASTGNTKYSEESGDENRKCTRFGVFFFLRFVKTQLDPVQHTLIVKLSCSILCIGSLNNFVFTCYDFYHQNGLVSPFHADSFRFNQQMFRCPNVILVAPKIEYEPIRILLNL